jgi:hypothetical protein
MAGSTWIDAINAAYPAMARLYDGHEANKAAADQGYYVCSGADVVAGTAAGKVKINTGQVFSGTTEVNIGTALDNIACVANALATTVAAGSNGTHTNTFTGSTNLTVASTTGFPSSGVIIVTHSATVDLISYTSTDATHFINCTLITGYSDATLATSDTVVGCNADLTNPRWGIIEVDTTTTPNVAAGALNLGTASASPVFPALTASRSAHAWIYIPSATTMGASNAMGVDALTSTANGKAKMIDARQLRLVHYPRLIATDTSTAVTNPTALTSILTAPIVLPANSMSATTSEMYIIQGTIRYLNNQNASTVELKLTLGAATVMDWTTASLTTSATARPIPFQFHIVLNGAGSGFYMGGHASVGAPGTTAGTADVDTANFQNTVVQSMIVSTTIDLQAKVTTSSSACTFGVRGFSIVKYPV